jgi:hypothetical protein
MKMSNSSLRELIALELQNALSETDERGNRLPEWFAGDARRAIASLKALLSTGEELFGKGEWIDEVTETIGIISSMELAASALAKRTAAALSV